MERYLEGEEISHEEIVHALEDGTDHGHIFPVTCGVATAHLGADRLLDAIVDDLPSPVQHGGLELEDMTLEPTEDGETFAYVFKTRADPFAGRINLFRVYQGTSAHDTQLLNTRAHTRSAWASCSCRRARRSATPTRSARRHRRGGQAQGDARGRLARRPRPADLDAVDRAPGAGHGVRDRAEGEGRRGQGLHRAAAPPGGGPDDRPAPRRRRPASRSWPGCRRSTSR
jgi:hypothetical protein